MLARFTVWCGLATGDNGVGFTYHSDNKGFLPFCKKDPQIHNVEPFYA